MKDHIENLIDIWMDFNSKHITQEAIDALKQTIVQTIDEYN